MTYIATTQRLQTDNAHKSIERRVSDVACEFSESMVNELFLSTRYG
jgi:uncharacterized Zn-finger protein